MSFYNNKTKLFLDAFYLYISFFVLNREMILCVKYFEGYVIIYIKTLSTMIWVSSIENFDLALATCIHISKCITKTEKNFSFETQYILCVKPKKKQNHVKIQ